MKILLLWDYYDVYLRYYYAHHPQPSGSTYAQQHQALLDDFFGWPSFLIREFQALGHEAHIIIGDAQPLQMAWARENNFPVDEHSWRFSIVQEQIRRFRPDVLWVAGVDHYLGTFLREAKRSSRYVVIWKAVASSADLDWSAADLVLSSQQRFVEQFRSLGLRSELFLPCFDRRILQYFPSRAPEVDLCFVGTLSAAHFGKRLELISYVQKHVPLQIHGEKLTWRRRPWPLQPFIAQARFIRFSLQTPIHAAVYGLDMFRLLHNSKIILNSHLDAAGGLAGNIRMFETTGVGALLITEAAPNLRDLFKPEKEVVTYRSPAEAVEKIRFYLAHDAEREMIAHAGQERTFREHDSRIRAEQALELFSSSLSGRE